MHYILLPRYAIKMPNLAGGARCAANWRPQFEPPRSTCSQMGLSYQVGTCTATACNIQPDGETLIASV